MQENQTFTSIDTLSVFALLVGVVSLVIALVTSAMVDRRIASAKVQADRIAIQMIYGDYGLPKDGRGPASFAKSKLGSEGKIAQDPWGNPFLYHILNDAAGRYVAIVTSGGANGVVETQAEDVRIDEDGRFQWINTRGDDVVAVQKSIN